MAGFVLLADQAQMNCHPQRESPPHPRQQAERHPRQLSRQFHRLARWIADTIPHGRRALESSPDEGDGENDGDNQSHPHLVRVAHTSPLPCAALLRKQVL
jgi:hypothetical protein